MAILSTPRKNKLQKVILNYSNKVASYNHLLHKKKIVVARTAGDACVILSTFTCNLYG